MSYRPSVSPSAVHCILALKRELSLEQRALPTLKLMKEKPEGALPSSISTGSSPNEGGEKVDWSCIPA
jgi:hypothetical protein